MHELNGRNYYAFKSIFYLSESKNKLFNMKQSITFLFAVICMWCMSTFNSTAQEYEEGTMVANVGIGLGGYGALGFGAIGFGASIERGIKQTGDFGVIGAGVFAGIRTGKYGTLGFTTDTRETTFAISPRGTYHFTVIPVENLDVYAAVQVDIAFRTIDNPNAASKVNDTDIYPAVIAGARYYFNDNLAGYVELGGNSLVLFSAGLAFRF